MFLRVERRSLRFPIPLIVCALLGAAAPLVAVAQSVPTYTWVSNWPLPGDPMDKEFRKQEGLGVCTDAEGRVYMSHATANPVLVYDRQGRFITSWGQGILHDPHSIRIDPEGFLWVTDKDHQQVFKFTRQGVLLGTYGTKGKIGVSENRLNEPTDIAFGKFGQVYVSDGYKNNRVVQLTSDLKFVRTWGRRGGKPGEFRLPHSIATDPDGLVYVADRENKRIQIFSPEGVYIKEFKVKEKPFSLFITPERLLYIANAWAETITIHDLEGNLLGGYGKKTKDRPRGALSEPHMLCVDTDGSVYAGELKGHRWQKWAPK